MKTINITSLPIDPTLTPQNAKEKGYSYIDDVIYDPKNPNDAMIAIIELSKEIQCKLGMAGSPLDDTYYGLFIPLRKIL